MHHLERVGWMVRPKHLGQGFVRSRNDLGRLGRTKRSMTSKPAAPGLVRVLDPNIEREALQTLKTVSGERRQSVRMDSRPLSPNPFSLDPPCDEVKRIARQ